MGAPFMNFRGRSGTELMNPMQCDEIELGIIESAF